MTRRAIAAARRRSSSAPGRFLSDPGPGNFYPGIRAVRSTVATHEAKLGAPLAMERIYSTNDTPPWSAADTTRSAGRIPWISWLEGSRSMSSIASGAQDAWIDSIAAGFAARAPWPIYWTFHHEPENDGSTSGANAVHYRNAQRRIKQRLRSAGVTNDVFCAVCYMTPYTWNFTNSGGRDWRTWYPDWKNVTGVGNWDAPDPNDFYVAGDPDSVVDCIGLDAYHGWDMAGNPPAKMTKWDDVTGTSVVARVSSRSDFLGKPWAIGEWATAAAQDGLIYDPDLNGTYTLTEYNAQVSAGTIHFYPDQTTAWIDDYMESYRQRTVAFCWFDSALVPSTVVANNPLSVCDPAETRWAALAPWHQGPHAKLWTP